MYINLWTLLKQYENEKFITKSLCLPFDIQWKKN